MKLISFDEQQPPEDELVIVIQQMTGICLRRFIGDESYDENEIYDDAELENYSWASLAEIRGQMDI